MTTFEPGAKEDFTHGLRCKPFSKAFFATKPAAIITLGLEVLVHEVIAAITTAPFFNCKSCPSTVQTMLGSSSMDSSAPTAAPAPPSPIKRANSFLLTGVLLSTNCLNACGTCDNTTLSCGRFGPAKLASTVPMSNSNTSVNSGSSPALRHKPCCLQ